MISALVAISVLSQVPAELVRHMGNQEQEESSTSSAYLTVGMWNLCVLFLHEMCQAGVRSVWHGVLCFVKLDIGGHMQYFAASLSKEVSSYCQHGAHQEYAFLSIQ